MFRRTTTFHTLTRGGKAITIVGYKCEKCGAIHEIASQYCSRCGRKVKRVVRG